MEKLWTRVEQAYNGINYISKGKDRQVSCPFVCEKILADGYCCFRILENVARKDLKWKGSQAVFVREVAKAAVKMAEAAANEIGEGALVEANSLQELKNLAKHAKPVESLGLWEKLEVQFILKGFVDMFHGKVVVHVYQASNGQVRNSMTYGSGTVVVNLLQWNNAIQHYDLLVPKIGK